MCGIAGYFGNLDAGEAAEGLLHAMIGEVRHRGPDAAGVLVAPAAGLAHSRLSIIDLSPGGAQPMSNDDGTISITFNGEIFNYVELREELIARGRRFRTYIRYGSHPPPLRGDGDRTASSGSTATSLSRSGTRGGVSWCSRATAWACVRSSTPTHGGVLYFASEVKALLQVRAFAPSSTRSRSTRSSRSGFRSRRARSSRTCASCRPAHLMVANADGMRDSAATGRSTFPTPSDAGADRRTEDEIAEELRALLDRCHAHPAALRRAGRRLPFRRARLLASWPRWPAG